MANNTKNEDDAFEDFGAPEKPEVGIPEAPEAPEAPEQEPLDKLASMEARCAELAEEIVSDKFRYEQSIEYQTKAKEEYASLVNQCLAVRRAIATAPTTTDT